MVEGKPCLYAIFGHIPGSGFMLVPEGWKSEYDTADEAADAMNRFFASLNIAAQNRVVILVDDVGV